MRIRPTRTLFVLLAWVIAIAASAAERITDLRPTVLLISIDGCRYDYLDKIDTPNLHSLIERGTRAKWMIPSFPTKTYPNHYTIVTGLYPAHHGMVANNMYDPIMNARFTMKDADDARWWGGEPIWVTAEKQGVHAAPLLWPGALAKEEGVESSFQMAWREGISIQQRVAKVAEVLDQPVSNRPQLITMYFDMVDDAGHHNGPMSPQVVTALQQVDDGVGQILKVLHDRGIEDQVNIIVVSDHGMSPISAKKVVYLDKYLDPKTVDIVDASPVLALRPKDGNARALYEELKNIKHGKAYLAENVPERWHYSGNRRIQPVMVMADDNWTINTREYFAKHEVEAGNHGFDNKTKNMRAIFLAAGPAFQHGEMKPFPNVDVYSLMAYVLNLQPVKNDGSLDPFQSVLVQRSDRNPTRKMRAPWQKEWDEVALNR
jgi:predicted AlkP superfamily pyrophosphatase or phosphodiesterase